MTYFTIRNRSTIEFVEKKSRFIASISTISSRDEAMGFIAQIKKSHPGATHNCTAFIAGNPESPTDIHYNDDGEPSGTAGKPMLQILLHKAIGNVVVVVTRYFGGVKLGTGGLVRAYSKAAKDCIESAEIIAFVKKTTLTTSFDYQYEKTVRKIIEASDSALLDAKYTECVTFTIELESDKMAELCNEITEISQGKVLFKGSKP